jgi:hypothetical protein
MLGQYQPLSTYHLPSAPILTVPIPNIPVSVAEKALDSLKQNDVSILQQCGSQIYISAANYKKQKILEGSSKLTR